MSSSSPIDAAQTSSSTLHDEEEAKFASLLGDFNLLKEIAATLLLPSTGTTNPPDATATATTAGTLATVPSPSSVVKSLAISNKVILNVTASFHQFAFEVHRWCLLSLQPSGTAPVGGDTAMVTELQAHVAACRHLFAKAAQLASWSVRNKTSPHGKATAAEEATTMVVAAVAGLLCNSTCKLRVRLALHNLEQAVHHVAKHLLASVSSTAGGDEALQAQVDGLKTTVVSLKTEYEQLVRAVHPPSKADARPATEEGASSRQARVQQCLRHLEQLSDLSIDAICEAEVTQTNVSPTPTPNTAATAATVAACTVVNPRTLAFHRPHAGIPLGVTLSLKEQESSAAAVASPSTAAASQRPHLELVVTAIPGHPNVVLAYGKPAVVVAVNGLSNPNYPNAMLSTIESAAHTILMEVRDDAFVAKPGPSAAASSSSAQLEDPTGAAATTGGKKRRTKTTAVSQVAVSDNNDAMSVEQRNQQTIADLVGEQSAAEVQPAVPADVASEPAVGGKQKRKRKSVAPTADTPPAEADATMLAEPAAAVASNERPPDAMSVEERNKLRIAALVAEQVASGTALSSSAKPRIRRTAAAVSRANTTLTNMPQASPAHRSSAVPDTTTQTGGVTVVQESPDRWVLHRTATTVKWGIRGLARNPNGDAADGVVMLSAIGSETIAPARRAQLLGNPHEDLTLVVQFQPIDKSHRSTTAVEEAAPSVDTALGGTQPIVPTSATTTDDACRGHEILDGRTIRLRRASGDAPWGIRLLKHPSAKPPSIALSAAEGVVLSSPHLVIQRINGTAVHSRASALRQLQGATEAILELEEGSHLTAATPQQSQPTLQRPQAPVVVDDAAAATVGVASSVTMDVRDNVLVFQRSELHEPWPVAVAHRRAAAAMQKAHKADLTVGQCLFELEGGGGTPLSSKKSKALERLFVTMVPPTDANQAAAAAGKRFLFVTGVNGTPYRRVGDFKHALSLAKKRLMLTCVRR